jgi:predicted phage baseplate assembly protein
MNRPLVNRPGLSAIAYRAGTFSSFFEAMKARLSSADYPGLAALRTRDPGDWTIALLDGWASIADVLTFYQERIANEGYIRTATERLSVLELGRTVGYALRPGVAATAYFAYTLDKSADSTIPTQTLAQSTPQQGQLPQAFETSDDLHATGPWNKLGIRLKQPQDIDLGTPPNELFLQGTNLKLNPDDVLLLVGSGSTGGAQTTLPMRIVQIEIQQPASRTRVVLAPLTATIEASASATALGLAATPYDLAVRPESVAPPALAPASLLAGYDAVKDGLLKQPAAHVASAADLPQSVRQSFAPGGDAIAKTLTALHPELATTLFPAITQATTAAPADVDVFALRIKALPFGASAPLQLLGFKGRPEREQAHDERDLHNVPDYADWELATGRGGDEAPEILWLDRFYPALAPNTWIVVNGPGEAAPVVATIGEIKQLGRARYGISGSPARLRLSRPWYGENRKDRSIGFLRGTNVFAQSEKLALADLSISEPLAGDTIALDGLYDGLDPGRWLIVAGTRSDVPGAPAAELMMLASSTHTVDPNLPGDTLHTQLTLSNSLAYAYERTSVQIYGNVVRATNGQTWKETLGSGDGSLALQTFTLKQKPLTFVPAASAAGAETTLGVTVDGVAWTEYESFDAMGPTDRGYVTQTDNLQNTSVIFGDGVHGARLPTGVENVKAVYRAGIGQAGNVDPAQITLLANRPLGVKAITNPLPAAGGADPESADSGRNNVPLATAALDRIVSLDDYAAVARTFAGVAKALTLQFPGTPPLVHVTVAGDGDAAIAAPSDLVTNLSATLLAQGDPQIALDIQPRALIVLVLSASVALEPGAQWAEVQPAIRAALLDQFGFERRNLAQDVYLSEIVAAIQNVAGVSHARITVFDGVSDANVSADFERLGRTAEGPNMKIVAQPPRRGAGGTVLPAQLAIFDPDLPEAIVLQEVAS